MLREKFYQYILYVILHYRFYTCNTRCFLLFSGLKVLRSLKTMNVLQSDLSLNVILHVVNALILSKWVKDCLQSLSQYSKHFSLFDILLTQMIWF